MGRTRSQLRPLVLAATLLVGCTATGDAGTGDVTTTAAPTSPAPGDGAAPTTATTADGLPAGRDVVVTSITDGDTFRAGDERVRLTGIDTPEVSGPVECFGPEATGALDELIPPGTEVRLVLDVEPEDRYDRTLAYVYRRDDGAFVNLALARDGFAVPLSIEPNVSHADDVDAAVAEARAAGRGLWSACPAEDEGSEAAPTPTTTADGGAAGCDPSYPDACIPPPPPDLDCADVPDRSFTVLPPDPHHLDGGGDGTGCEAP